MDVRDIGILFYLTASSATVADALEHLARYIGTTNEAFLVEISRGKAETVMTVRHIPALDEPRRQFSEFSMLEGSHQSILEGDESGFRPLSRNLCARAELGTEGGPSHPSMPGRVHACHRQLSPSGKRHGAADSFE
jgi:hypothetical protein